MYFLKLHHLVDDKIHARSTGPYSLVTQQPLGGKAPVWRPALWRDGGLGVEAYGAAYTLQEILTVKSDDVVGRVKPMRQSSRAKMCRSPGVPESFKVLIKELQSLGLDVKVLDKEENEIDLKQNFDGDEPSFSNADEEVFREVNDMDTAKASAWRARALNWRILPVMPRAAMLRKRTSLKKRKMSSSRTICSTITTTKRF